MNRILLPACLCAALLSACGGQTEAPQETTRELFLTDSLQNVVSVDTVHIHEVADELTLNGRVTFNQEQVARVFPIFGGTMTEVSAEIGDHVRKGDILAVIRSGEVADYEKQKKVLIHIGRGTLIQENLRIWKYIQQFLRTDI